jgi:hypothetical protein
VRCRNPAELHVNMTTAKADHLGWDFHGKDTMMSGSSRHQCDPSRCAQVSRLALPSCESLESFLNKGLLS